MGSFVGTYEYNLDSKNRLVVPPLFKELIGNTFIVRAKPGKFSHSDCFFPANFESTVNAEIEDYINKGLPADMAAAMARTCSTAVTVDAHGRICIPSKILERAHISKESVFQGMGDRFEMVFLDRLDFGCRSFGHCFRAHSFLPPWVFLDSWY